MNHKGVELFEFEGFRLNAGERRLERNGEPVQLPPKVFDLLVVLVRNRGHPLEKDEILKTLWPDSFVEESNLSVNVSALRRALGEAANGARFIETVPKRGYRFIAAVAEIAAVEVPHRDPAEPNIVGNAAAPSKRVLLAAGSIALALAASYWIARTIGLAGPSLSSVRSIAILPFLPLGGDEAQSYLGLGMADAIITRLGGLKKLEVRPTSAVLKYAGAIGDPFEVGKTLRVDAVLEGRVQQVDKRLRVTVQLLSAREGKQLWAETFDDYFTNIFAVQDTISEKVASALSLDLGGSDRPAGSRRSTENTEAYRLYLQGQYLASKRLHEATLGAIEYFEKAVAADPDYTLAYAAMANACLIRAGEGWGGDLRMKAKNAALRAISLDDKAAEAHLALGQVLMRADWDWSGADRAFRRAIATDPRSAYSHAALSTLFTALGRHDEAIGEMEFACRLDPTSASLRSDLAWALHFARRYQDAIREASRAVNLDVWSYTAHRQLGKAYLFQSRFPEAIEEAKKAFEINGGRRRRVFAELANAYVRAGQRAQANSITGDLRHLESGDPEPHYEMAVLHAALGDHDAAFQALEAACELRLTRVIWMNQDPEIDPLRADTRYKRLLGKLGLSP